MRILKTERSLTIFLTAILTAIGALIISPLSITLGFWLTDYLARPVLSLEYTEIITETRQLATPKNEINSLIMSPYFQSSVLNGRAGSANMLAAYVNKEKLSNKDVAAIRDITTNYVTMIEDRNKSLKEDISTLGSKDLSDDRLWGIALEYAGLMRQNMTTLSQAETLKNSLIEQINNDLEAGEESKGIARTLLDGLNDGSKDVIEKIYLKISVLNKGNTDGLVRGIGEIQIPKINTKLPIINCVPPNKKKQMAIVVTFADDLPKAPRSTSVGKVEKHSLKEFWYVVENNDEFESSFNKFIEYITSNGSITIDIYLSDHEGESIHGKFTISI